MQIYFDGHIFFGRGGGRGLKLSLNVFHHNNNFDLINIYSAKTITIEYKKYGSIHGVNKTIIWFQIHFLFFKSNSSNLIMCYNQMCLSLMRTGACEFCFGHFFSQSWVCKLF